VFVPAVSVLLLTSAVSPVDYHLRRHIEEAHGPVTTMFDNTPKLPTASFDVVVIGPSVCQTTYSAPLCSPSSTVLEKLKIGAVATGNGYIWKKMGLAAQFSRSFESFAQLTVTSNVTETRSLEFPVTLTTYESTSTHGQVYLQGTLRLGLTGEMKLTSNN
jgi:hypothetical protein